MLFFRGKFLWRFAIQPPSSWSGRRAGVATMAARTSHATPCPPQAPRPHLRRTSTPIVERAHLCLVVRDATGHGPTRVVQKLERLVSARQATRSWSSKESVSLRHFPSKASHSAIYRGGGWAPH